MHVPFDDIMRRKKVSSHLCLSLHTPWHNNAHALEFRMEWEQLHALGPIVLRLRAKLGLRWAVVVLVETAIHSVRHQSALGGVSAIFIVAALRWTHDGGGLGRVQKQ